MLKGIITGKGGQGVITINATLGQLAADFGYRVISSETHGMAMRGGSVATSIKIGNYKSASVGRGSADFILSLDMDEALRNFSFLRKDGVCIINSPEKHDFPDGYRIACFDTESIAFNNFGKSIYSGQILLGMLIQSFDEIFSKNRSIDFLQKYPRINTEAVKAGMNLLK